MISATFSSAIDNSCNSVYQSKQCKYGYLIFSDKQEFATSVKQFCLRPSEYLFFNFIITTRNTSNCFSDKTKCQRKTGKEKKPAIAIESILLGIWKITSNHCLL